MIHALIFAGVAFFHPHAKDSLGVETVNGKVFVIHKVDEKETLYAISRRYGAPVDAILKSNPGLSQTLEVGQIVKVPYSKKPAQKSPTAATANVHKVAAKETMYSIARMYNITVDDLKKWNDLADNTLSVGQELVVKKPKPGETSSSNQSVTTNKKVENTPVPTNGLYTVETGETLYSVARKFGLSVNQIKAWNSLQSEELKVGQSIYVSAPVQGRTQTETVTQTKKDVDPVSKPDTRQETKKDVTTQPVVTKNETTEARNETKPQTIKISESMKNSDEVVESGVAELIEGTEGNRKYLALHRTAPVGTILKVRNEMNNREVFVRVMGKLPDTAVNDKLVIKISRSAYDRLGAIDPRFRVELTYYK